MSTCSEIEPALASYVEGGPSEAERGQVDDHLRTCPACRARVSGERAACDLLRARKHQLRGSASDRLRARCAAQRAPARAAAPVRERRLWVPLSLAATLVLVAGLFVLFGMSSPVESYAAQLAVDHMKCFRFPPGGGTEDAAALGQRWQGDNGWPLRIDPGTKAERLELVGLRRCGSTQGRVAHILYRWRGQPLSVYVLNGRVDLPGGTSHPSELDWSGTAHAEVEMFGEQEIIWSERGRTYAVVARASLPELQRVAGYVRRRIE